MVYTEIIQRCKASMFNVSVLDQKKSKSNEGGQKKNICEKKYLTYFWKS